MPKEKVVSEIEARKERIENKRSQLQESDGRFYISLLRRIAKGHKLVGYLYTILSSQQNSTSHFEQSSSYYTRCQRTMFELWGTDADYSNPGAARGGMLMGVLSGSHQHVDEAVDAFVSIDESFIEDLSRDPVHYYQAAAVAALIRDTDDVASRIRTYEQALDGFSQDDIPYDTLADSYWAIHDDDSDALETALRGIDSFHESKYGNSSDIVEQHLCEQLVQTVALADYYRVGVDVDLEYAPKLPGDS